jgi:hypothetical protein
LLKLLERGTEAAGLTGQLRSSHKVAQYISEQFGVTYHLPYRRTLLRLLSGMQQNPKRYASERDDAALEEWIARQWRRVKKNAAAKRHRDWIVDRLAPATSLRVARLGRP